MIVTHIDIRDLHQSATGHTGHATLEFRPARPGASVRMHFHCHADAPADCPSALIIRALIADALRQARRMPGFRRGEQAIELAAEAQIAPRTATA